MPFATEYPEAERFLFRFYGSVFLVLFVIGLVDVAFDIQFTPAVSSSFIGVALCLLLLAPRLFVVSGKKKALIVTGAKVLKPRESACFWRLPQTASKVPLIGSWCKAEFEVPGDTNFPSLRIFIPELDFIARGRKNFIFLVKFSWEIDPAVPISLGQVSSIAQIYKHAIDGIMANNLPQEICGYIRKIVIAKMGTDLDDWGNPSVTFSEVIFDEVVAELERQASFKNEPFIKIDITSLKAAIEIGTKDKFVF